MKSGTWGVNYGAGEAACKACGKRLRGGQVVLYVEQHGRYGADAYLNFHKICLMDAIERAPQDRDEIMPRWIALRERAIETGSVF